MIYADFESILVPENNKSKIQMSLIQANIVLQTCCFQFWL